MISFLHRYLPFITLFLVTIVSTSDYSIYGKSLGELITLQFIIIFAFRLANADANFGKGSLLFFVSIINDALQGLQFGTSALLYFTIFSVATYQAGIKLRSLFLAEWVSFIFAVTCCYIILFFIESLFYDNPFPFTLYGINFACTVVAYPIFWLIIQKIIYRNA